MNIKKSYQVLRTLGLAGTIHEIGHVIQLEGKEIENLILGGFLKEIPMSEEEQKAPEAAPAEAAPQEATPEAPAPEPTPAPEAAPAEDKPAEGS